MTKRRKFKCGYCGKQHDIRSLDEPIKIQFGPEGGTLYFRLSKSCHNKLWKHVSGAKISEDEFEYEYFEGD